MFHCDCYDNYIDHRRNTQLRNRQRRLDHARSNLAGEGRFLGDGDLTPRKDCPNCREDLPQVIAIWRYQIARSRAQESQYQPNMLSVGQLNGAVQVTGVVTPRSVVTELD